MHTHARTRTHTHTHTYTNTHTHTRARTPLLQGDAFKAISFDSWADESDLGPYPFPPGAKTEGSYTGCSEKV